MRWHSNIENEVINSLLSVLLQSFQTTDHSLKEHHSGHLEPASTDTESKEPTLFAESQLSVLLCLEDLPEILDGLHKQMTSTPVIAGSVDQSAQRHKTFVYHLYNVGPTSKTLGRRCINVIQMFAGWVGVVLLSVVAQYYHHIYYVHLSYKLICIGFKSFIYKINNRDNVSFTRTVATTTLFSATACKKCIE